ncbi:MAG: hypothetical protein SFW07_04315, partial [Gammaproteobacteria bacterium]|nr:hypothetical protein [Gammaproteobacteria bacterium]
DIAGYGVPEMRQALRNPKLTLPEAVKIALTTAVEKDVEAVCRDVSEAKEKFKDECFVDEIEANLQLKQRIKEDEVIYGEYKKFEPKVANASVRQEV